MSYRPIYLDNHATTTVDERVMAAMMPYFMEYFGNSGSINHQYGWEAEAGIKQAREQIATAINATPEEIVFTSGATEANNLAIKGIAEAYFQKGKHIITVQTEHNAVLHTCQYLESLGFEVTYLPVQSDGLVNLQQLDAAFRPDTILVSVMAGNNEIGVLQPIGAIGIMCREREVLFHTDAAQAVGKSPIDVEAMRIDLMSITAHKIYGPKGIGALYVRRRNPRVKLAPQMHGGGQERGMRAGTLFTPQIVGFGKAMELCTELMETESARLLALRERLWHQLSSIDDIYLNGHPTMRVAGNLNVSIGGVDGAALRLGLQSVVALSSSSACSTGKANPSHVLMAIGRSEELSRASLRFGIGRFNTEAEIDQVAEATISTINSLRQATIKQPAII
ncbi:MAG TPA: IscS subfamily cysteine desulfurase [Oscillatoriaceae cyanobacterium M33_DOE_052]|uniref:cysteine desulfurase n=1 Tax=Planktothricoides sp. SpSt-374 TaxID=2282167 RepID=A0A7C3ZL97_9CYAN|nr:IscS subfamily cysteine desulfurase [Oscillatoriaceae cyanobacterium M33_DOE_052]